MARILYIEDDPGMIDLVTTIVTRRGYEITGAVGGHQGLEILKSQTKKPDLILLDLMMPDMDGWEVYQQIKANEATKDIPVIIVTAKAQNIDKVLGLQIAKVDDYVTKPFGPQDLVSSIEKVLNKSK
ncbi:MAG: response regulator [Chloroflexota bacterium]|jgi:DNA-binding response OmpR family regulator